MPDQLQLRGGTTTEHNSFTGVTREVTVDTTKKTLVVHDGSTQGGTPLMKESGANSASSVNIGTGGTNRLGITSSEIVINENSSDTDFRIESDSNTHALFVNAGNGRIGVNKSAPDYPLDVDGDIGCQTVRVLGATPGIRFTDTADTGGYGHVGVNNNSGSLTLRSDDGNALNGSFMSFEVDGGERMRIDEEGRIGIGTTTQNSVEDGAGLKVDTYQQSSTTYHRPDGYYGASLGEVTNAKTKVWAAVDAHYAQTNAVSAGIFLKAFHQDTGGSACGATIKNLKAGNALTFNTVTTAASINNPAVETERMRITGNSVGIGTTGPSSSYGLEVHKESTGTAIPLCLRNPNKTNGSSTRIRFQGNNTSDAPYHLGELAFFNMDNYGQYADFALSTHALGTTSEALRIKGSNKRLGFNTQNPEAKVHIETASNNDGILVKTTGNNYLTVAGDANRTAAGDNLVRYEGRWNGNAVTRIRMLAGDDTTNKDDGDICFDTAEGGSMGERLRIAQNGYIGIGTSDPASKFHLMEGDIFLTRNSTDTDSGGSIYFQTTTNGWATSGAHSAIHGKRGANSSGYLRFDTRISGTTAERMRIAPDGKVGIGTAPSGVDPTSELTVHGVIETNAFDSNSGSGGRYTPKGFLIGDAYSASKASKNGVSNDRNHILWQERGLDVNFGVSDEVAMTLDYNGRLKIAGGYSASIPIWGIHGKLQVNGTGWQDTGITLTNFGNDATRASLQFAKSYSGTKGTYGTAPPVGNSLGSITWAPDDTTDFNNIVSELGAECHTISTQDNGYGRVYVNTREANSAGRRISIDVDGIKFGSDTATTNGLNDYEEGTFSPAIDNGFTNASINAISSGFYTKVGRMVTVSFFLRITASGSGQHVRFGNLPFSSRNHTNSTHGGGIVTYTNIPGLNSTNGTHGVWIGNNSTTCELYNNGNSASATGSGGFTNNDIYVTMTYHTN